ncbi:histone-like nucleoid-structuring protein Lsr2, partial [Rhizobium sp. YIM 134829]|uniref:Lsr2 family DNA-binding protein n=1 Tax=Rhizobium sp. YIM 134829 TaxID=3390453 RepID=UPI00397BD220
RMDLSTRNVSKFDKTLTPYINAALEITGDELPRNRRTKKPRSTKAKAGTSTSAIRAWATENGYTVSPRGRVPREVLEAFENATTQ